LDILTEVESHKDRFLIIFDQGADRRTRPLTEMRNRN